MADMARIRVEWTGLTGLPGVSTFFQATTVAVSLTGMFNMFTALKPYFPPGLAWTIPNAGDIIRDTDGQLQGTWGGTGGGSVSATGGLASYPAGVGARTRWLTDDVVAGRRVSGATFWAPLIGAAYQNNGTLEPTVVSDFTTIPKVMILADDYLVWHRPTPGLSNGSSHTIVNTLVKDQVSTLRTRRT